MLSILKRKKQDEEDQEEQENKVKIKRSKKKDQPKPWGKKERLLVFVVLFSTISSSVILALSARAWKLPGINLQLIPNFSLSKTYVIENQSNEDFSIIVDDFKSLTKDKTGVYSFYVARVYRHSSYGYRMLDSLDSDSLIQMATLAHLFKSAEAGSISLKQEYVLKRSDKIGNLGLKLYQPSSILTYRELAAQICINSDVLAEKILLNALGEQITQAALGQYLFSDTSVIKKSTTASDIGFFLKRLVESDFLDDGYQEEYLDCMRKGSSSEFGDLVNGQFVYKHDIKPRQASIAGVVFAPKPYVLVIIGEGVVESEAEELLPKAIKVIGEFEGNF